MELYYETERLILRILREDSAPDVLDFYSKNRAVFELWEPDRPQNFYTKEYQATLLQCEFQMTLKMAAVRFWMFEKSDPGKIIGTVSFQNIMRSVYQSCQIGYKLAPAFWHYGYAREGIAKAISIVLKEYNLHRIEALVLPCNQPSIHLLERLGFQEEGLCHSCIYLHSNWADHIRYSYIRPDTTSSD